MNRCPYCGYETDATTDLHINGSRPPVAGDLAICVRCERVGIFTGRGDEVRGVSSTEDLGSVYSPEVLAIVDELRDYKKASGWAP